MNTELTNERDEKKAGPTLGNYLRFIIPSLMGIILFLVPIKAESGGTTILFSVVTDILKGQFSVALPYILVLVTVASAVLSAYFSIKARSGQVFSEKVSLLFVTNWLWIALRTLGAIFTVMVVFGFGPELITAEVTGGTMISFLAPNLLVLFFLASIALPLLTDYGFMEFFGSLVSKAFKALFRLPGRSAIDGLASWLGAAVIGVMLTVQQYEKGVYTKREAASIASTFSIVSLPFCAVIAGVAGLTDIFWSYYGSVMLIGFICALIMPRIPPLSTIPDEYKLGVGKTVNDDALSGEGVFKQGLRMGLARGKDGPGFVEFIFVGLSNLANILLTILPATLAIGMIALMVVEFTPIFQTLSYPIVKVLEYFSVAEASAAGPGFLVGFADMYLPALIAKGIESQETRYLIAILSVSQLIYMSEVGVYLIRAKLGLNIGHLVAIFCIRTLIAAPVAILLARYVIF